MNLILLGAPGAGKGTQAAILSQRLAIPAISTGNILRAAIKNGTPLGMKVKSLIDEGRLVPDEVIIEIMAERLAQSDCANGFILDGVPRTIAQAEAMERAGIRFDRVISIETPDEVIMDRLAGRRVCTSCGATYHVEAAPPASDGICDACGDQLETRKDDMPETIKERLEVYHKETEPLKDFYEARGLLSLVASQDTIEETTELILEVLRDAK